MEDNRTLTEQTADRIVEFIIEQGMTGGDRLPSEGELAKRLDVSRTTTREAVRMLASRNILEARQGSGLYISKNTGISKDPLGFLFIRDKEKLVEDLLEFRLLVEPRIAARAAQNAAPEQAEELEALAEAVEERIKSGLPHEREDNAFHAKLGELSGNVVFPNLAPIISGAIGMFIGLTQAKLKEETISSHRAIVEAVRRGDAAAASDAMTLHLVYNRELLRRQRRERDGEGKI